MPKRKLSLVEPSSVKTRPKKTKINNNVVNLYQSIDQNKDSNGKLMGDSKEIFSALSLSSENSSQINVIETNDNKKFSITSILGDGNCFYRATADQLKLKNIKDNQGNFYNWQELKNCAIDYILLNLEQEFGETLSHRLSSNEQSMRGDLQEDVTNIQQYLSIHRLNGTWVDSGMLGALAQSLNLIFRVYHNGSPATYNVGREEARILNLLYHENHYDSLIELTNDNSEDDGNSLSLNDLTTAKDNNSVLKDHPPENYKNKKLIDAGTNPAIQDEEKIYNKVVDIFQSVEKEDLSSIKKLIRAGTNPSIQDKEGKTALHIAAEMGHFDIAKYFINNHNNILNIKDKYIVHPFVKPLFSNDRFF